MCVYVYVCVVCSYLQILNCLHGFFPYFQSSSILELIKTCFYVKFRSTKIFNLFFGLSVRIWFWFLSHYCKIVISDSFSQSSKIISQVVFTAKIISLQKYIHAYIHT